MICLIKVTARSPFETIVCREAAVALEHCNFSMVPAWLVDTLAAHFSGLGTSKVCEDVMQRLQATEKSRNGNAKMSVPRVWLEAAKTNVLETFGTKVVEPTSSNFDRRSLPEKAPTNLFQHTTKAQPDMPLDDVTRHPYLNCLCLSTRFDNI